MKCDICKKSIDETFLKKIKGSYVKDSKGKKHPICPKCQKELGNDKQKIVERL